jgi:uncharacterized protein (DUF169 family)
MKLDVFHEYGEEIEKRLRLKTFPLAVKLVAKEADIPEMAKRPLRDFGHHLALCQGFALSRREGELMALLKEDMLCFEPVVGYGMAEPPQYFLDGHNRFPQDVETLEAGSNYAQAFPRLEVGRCVGVMSAPLTTASFEPDVVMLYCDSTQLSLALLGIAYKDGRDIVSTLSSHAACVYSVVPAIRDGKCQVSVPCRGDRYFAMAGDDEMIFTLPKERVEDLLVGLRHCEKYNSRLPKNYYMQAEPWIPDSYRKTAQMLGIQLDK